MKNNLDALTTEIPEYLQSKGLAVFQGVVNELHEQRLVFWDIDRTQDYRAFVDCAISAGVKLIIFNYRHFEKAMAEDALERLEETDLPREEQRTLSRRIKELVHYHGFTCLVELIFEINNRFYVFDLRTDWYAELLDLMDSIDMAGPGDDDGPSDDEPLGGGSSSFFSRN
ncbi:MAG: hypothetical protein HY820_12735 [Acidobacteria bacterium]|nr:hypothetical protein [Acidobacteriota bacterium]